MNYSIVLREYSFDPTMQIGYFFSLLSTECIACFTGTYLYFPASIAYYSTLLLYSCLSAAFVYIYNSSSFIIMIMIVFLFFLLLNCPYVVHLSCITFSRYIPSLVGFLFCGTHQRAKLCGAMLTIYRLFFFLQPRRLQASIYLCIYMEQVVVFIYLYIDRETERPLSLYVLYTNNTCIYIYIIFFLLSRLSLFSTVDRKMIWALPRVLNLVIVINTCIYIYSFCFCFLILSLNFLGAI